MTSQEPPDYIVNTPAVPGVHTEPPSTTQWENLSQDEVNVLRARLIESILQVVVQAVTGIFTPGGGIGGALGQLGSWASAIPGLGTIFNSIIGLIPGASGGLTGSSGLGAIFGDLFGILGSPTAVGSGTPVLPAVTSRPILGGLFSGGTLLGSLIPLLDASKISTGTLSSSILQPVIDAVSQGFGGSTGLGFSGLQSFLGGLTFGGIDFDDLIALVPGIGGGLTGSTGLGSIFTDLFGMLGSPTAVGTGTPVLPAVTSRPILGGLFSGSTLLGSLIPLLDASKISTGTFGTGLIPNLDVSKIVSGVFGTSFIPSLPASQITSGTFGAGLIPLLDASKISSGIFSTGLIPNLDVSKIVSGVFGTSFIPSLPASQITSGIFGAGLIPNLDASKVNTGTFADTFVPGIGSILDELFNGINNLGGSGRTHAEVADAVAAQSNTVVGTSATTAQILAALGTGNPDADDFERVSSSNLGANWSIYQTGTGTLATPNGHDATFTGSADATFVARKENKDAAGDNQIVSIVLSTAAEATGDTILIPTEFGQNDLWCRMTTFSTYATRTGLRLRFGADKSVKLSWFNSGTETVLASTTVANKPAAGATLELQAGVGLTTRRFIGKLNGTPVIDFTELGTTSQFGATYRRRGFGGETQHAIIVTGHPGGVKQWTTQG